MTSTDVVEAALIAAARTGDEGAYRRLVEPHRTRLHAHCYRMLGSLADADDALQDALVAAWRGLSGFEARSSLRTWLFMIATNACLRAGSKRGRRGLPNDLAPPADPRAKLLDASDEELWVDPYPDGELDPATPEARYAALEAIEIAFVAALQHLPPNQRAVLILRDVVGFSAEEAATTLDTTVASANSALQRARDTMTERHGALSQLENRRSIGEAAHEALVTRFVTAWQRGDVEGLVAMLAEGATFTMPPLPTWFSGREDIGVFFAETVFRLRWQFVRATVSGQPAIAAYQFKDDAQRFELEVLNLLDFRGERISTLTSFANPPLCARFGLPIVLPG